MSRNRVTGIPKLVGKLWDEVAKELQQFLERLKQAEGPAAVEGGEFSEVMEEAGDLISATKSAGVITPTRVPIGTATGSVLITNLAKAWKLSWETAATWLSRTITTKGDLLTSDGTTAQRMAVGAHATLLRSNTSNAVGLDWVSIETLLDEELDFDGAGDLLTHNGSVHYTLEPYKSGNILYSSGPGAVNFWWWPGSYWAFKNPASGVASSVATIPTTDGGVLLQDWSYSVQVRAGATDIQYSKGRFTLHGRNDVGGALTVTVLGLGPAAATEDVQYCSSGTLTVAISVSIASDVATLQITTTTSLGTPTITIRAGMTNMLDDNDIDYL